MAATALSGLSKIEDFEGPHAVYGVCLLAVVVLHVALNRRALLNYMKKYKTEFLLAFVIFIIISYIAFTMDAHELELHRVEYED